MGLAENRLTITPAGKNAKHTLGFFVSARPPAGVYILRIWKPLFIF
jgi:hypothetical protein